MTLPSISVLQHLAAAFAGQTSALPPAVGQLCDAVLMDVTGLCVAARHSDYVRATLQATAEPGICTAVGQPGFLHQLGDGQAADAVAADPRRRDVQDAVMAGRLRRSRRAHDGSSSCRSA